MLQISYYKKFKEDKCLYYVDIILEENDKIIASEGFENVEDAFEYAREYEEDIIGSCYPEEVWEYKFEMAKLCYEMSEEAELTEENEVAILEAQLKLMEKMMGEEKLAALIEEVMDDEIEEVNYISDIY